MSACPSPPIGRLLMHVALCAYCSSPWLLSFSSIKITLTQSFRHMKVWLQTLLKIWSMNYWSARWEVFREQIRHGPQSVFECVCVCEWLIQAWDHTVYASVQLCMCERVQLTMYTFEWSSMRVRDQAICLYALGIVIQGTRVCVHVFYQGHYCTCVWRNRKNEHAHEHGS